MIAIMRSNATRLAIAPSVLCQVILSGLLAPGFAAAQTPAAAPSVSKLDNYSPDQLMEKAKALKENADQSGAGSASIVLEKYPGHFTMLAFRDRSGGAELHKDYADIDVILGL